MSRKYTREGLAADIGAASSYSNQYYYGTDTGVYYYSDGSNWTITTFNEGRSVENHSDSITTGGTAQLVMSANADRKWLFFQNLSDTDMYLGLGYVPTATTGMMIAKNGTSLKLEAFVVTDAIYVLCTLASKVFIALEG
jgi:hypothetical protein